MTFGSCGGGRRSPRRLVAANRPPVPDRPVDADALAAAAASDGSLDPKPHGGGRPRGGQCAGTLRSSGTWCGNSPMPHSAASMAWARFRGPTAWRSASGRPNARSCPGRHVQRVGLQSAPNGTRRQRVLVRRGSRGPKGHEYRYLLATPAGDLWRMDPYARQVTDSVGNAVVHDPDFDWGGDEFRSPRGTNWWRTSCTSARSTPRMRAGHLARSRRQPRGWGTWPTWG